MDNPLYKIGKIKKESNSSNDNKIYSAEIYFDEKYKIPMFCFVVNISWEVLRFKNSEVNLENFNMLDFVKDYLDYHLKTLTDVKPEYFNITIRSDNFDNYKNYFL